VAEHSSRLDGCRNAACLQKLSWRLSVDSRARACSVQRRSAGSAGSAARGGGRSWCRRGREATFPTVFSLPGFLSVPALTTRVQAAAAAARP
jgi:hypothetical protein